MIFNFHHIKKYEAFYGNSQTKDENNQKKWGTINTNGLIIIPPIIKFGTFKQDGTAVNLTIEGISSELTITKEGNCISGDCSSYSQLLKKYFE